MIRLILKMPLQGKLRRYAETVDASANAMMTIVDDILDFSKMEAGKYTLQSVPFDPGGVLQEAAELMASRAVDKGLELICRRAPGVPQIVTGDPDRFRQILNNLVGNAIKFTEEGGVVIALDHLYGHPDGVEETARPRRWWVTVEVRDTGIGIAHADQARVFDEFEQVNVGARGDSMRQGTGLGLPISRRLAHLMGGTITLDSSPGRGSTFTLWLPAPAPPDSGLVSSGD
jgi:signal transduction histidine kinase